MLAKKTSIYCLLILALFAAPVFVAAQNPQTDKEYAQAKEYVSQGRFIDALPLLEKLSIRYPNDAEVHAQLGVAILTNSSTVKDEAKREAESARALATLQKAKKLGTENSVALHYLELLESGVQVGIAFEASSKEVEDALREGEGFFGRGEYDKAFKAYERAHKLDPKNYEAVLFMGDCFYAQKKFAESEPWFAKAVAIDPNREQAYRFWADALANQDKTDEAKIKFAEAYIAQPNSKVVFETFMNVLKDSGARRTLPFIMIPAKDDETEIVIDEKQIETEAEKEVWKSFAETRKRQIQQFSAVANGRTFVSTLAEDAEALKSAATAARAAMQKAPYLKLNQSLQNLIKLDSQNLLDVYLIFFIHGGDRSPEYEKFRDANRERMKKFLVDYFLEDKL